MGASFLGRLNLGLELGRVGSGVDADFWKNELLG